LKNRNIIIEETEHHDPVVLELAVLKKHVQALLTALALNALAKAGTVFVAIAPLVV